MALTISYTPAFLRQLKKLGAPLISEVKEIITYLSDQRNHTRLKVHKLHGKHRERFSCSVDYRNRIVFTYLTKQEIVLLAVGDHEIYN